MVGERDHVLPDRTAVHAERQRRSARRRQSVERHRSRLHSQFQAPAVAVLARSAHLARHRYLGHYEAATDCRGVQRDQSSQCERSEPNVLQLQVSYEHADAAVDVRHSNGDHRTADRAARGEDHFLELASTITHQGPAARRPFSFLSLDRHGVCKYTFIYKWAGHREFRARNSWTPLGVSFRRKGSRRPRSPISLASCTSHLQPCCAMRDRNSSSSVARCTDESPPRLSSFWIWSTSMLELIRASCCAGSPNASFRLWRR